MPHTTKRPFAAVRHAGEACASERTELTEERADTGDQSRAAQQVSLTFGIQWL
jgi:hypothetical protein